ncbi:DUF3347 domain-containing protein [Mucilaginibacter lacusdianchii]|uniref:DUF3347 domain-containing protein n=1 Tax=Mucilaginibacter lacusdianchii TaxID=2684211 RepID=UPI00131BC586|nr:DUF3347 domain-containing protein [Mucilaginibacter sp. JXJ CY 39]
MKTILYAGLIAIVITACQSKENKVADNAVDSTQTTTANVQAQSDTANAYHAYLKLKDNLVKADAKAAQQSALQLVTPLSNIKGCTEASDMAKKIAETADVKDQRTVFLTLSQDMIPLAKGYKTKSAPIYVAYCPMAGNGKGGYWLAAEKEIKNPYYGDDMLECGEVKEEIK